MPSRLRRALTVSLGILLAGCQQAPTKLTKERSFSASETTLASEVCESYARLAHAGYGDSVLGVRRLLDAVDRFLEMPTADGFVALRGVWLEARRSYQQTEVFRFYDGPIDEVETLVNTWPIDENFVEAGSSGAKPGVIDDVATYPEISKQQLARLNMKDGETSVSTGYHVIEYLLWGRDTRADGPGQRPYTDYVVEPPAVESRKPAAKLTVKAASAAAAAADTKLPELAKRRGAYLRAATELLLEDLVRVEAAWAPAVAGNYRDRFTKMSSVQALGLILKGMGALSGAELSGERLTVAYETKDQENEHSCFSDSTHDDMWRNALGIQNVCAGRYERTSGDVVVGQGLCELVALRNPVLGERLRTELEQSVRTARTIPAPFDQAILGDDEAPGRQAIAQTIAALRKQTLTLSEVAAAFDVRVTLAAGARP